MNRKDNMIDQSFYIFISFLVPSPTSWFWETDTNKGNNILAPGTPIVFPMHEMVGRGGKLHAGDDPSKICGFLLSPFRRKRLASKEDTQLSRFEHGSKRPERLRIYVA